MKTLLTATLVALGLTLTATPLDAQVTSNRRVASDAITLTPRPAGMFDVSYKVFCATQDPGQVDMSLEASLFLNGVLVDITPLSIIIGGGGQTCGGSCITPNCAVFGPDSTCEDFTQFGGVGCFCAVVVSPTNPIHIAARPGDVVTVQVDPAGLGIAELYQTDDVASATIVTTYNREIRPTDITFVPLPGGDHEIQVQVHTIHSEPTPIDLSMDLNVSVDGVYLGTVQILNHIIGGGGGTCSGPPCVSNGCTTECIDMTTVGGIGCQCDIIVTPNGNPTYTFRPGNTVTVEIVAAAGTAVDAWQDDDVVTVPFTGELGTAFCQPANANCNGVPTLLTGNGMACCVGLHLEAVQGPPSQFGYFLVGNASSDPGITISRGRLCLATSGGNTIGRYNVGGTTLSSIGAFDAAGVLQNLVGTSQQGSGFDVPATLPFVGSPTILMGSTWHFQLWHRDPCPTAGQSNFSNGLSVVF